MGDFHLIVRGLPDAPLPTSQATFDGVRIEVLDVPAALQSTPLPVTFEQAAESLKGFPRLHFEPDGSFVWVSPRETTNAWQVDGNLYDRGDCLNHVEIKGTCPPEALSRLLQVFTRPDSSLMIEHVPLGTFLHPSQLPRLLPTE